MPVTNDKIYAYLVDLSANIAQQFAEVLTQGVFIQTQNVTISNQVTDVQGYLISEINTGLLLNTQQLNAVIAQGDVIQAQNASISNQVTQQTNDINTNTNTALSQYTNTINTNTNKSVATAVEILHK